MAVDAINVALARRGVDVASDTIRSDRGSQFRAGKFYRTLDYHGRRLARPLP